jgi:hypothetical protein
MTRSLLRRLDDVANLTGIPQLSEKLAKRQQRRRHLRWWPIVALAIATVGLCLTFVTYGIGLVLVALPQGWSTFIAMFGPVKPWGTIEGVDERDIAVRRSAYLFGFGVTSLFMLASMAALVVVSVVEGWPAEMLLRSLGALWLYDLLLLVILPTLHASWATRPIEDE